MEIFTIFDLVALVLVTLSAMLAYSRGLLREAMSIVGWIVSAVIAYSFIPVALPYVENLPYLGDILQGNCELSVITAFAVLFAISLIAVGLITSALVRSAKIPAVTAVNQGLGFLFGVFRGILLLIIALIMNDTILPQGPIYEGIMQSQSARIFESSKNLVQGPIAEGAKNSLIAAFENVMEICKLDAQANIET